MGENLLRRKRKTKNSDRCEFLKCLVNELYTTGNVDAQRETLANLANFAYNPVNYCYFDQLNILDVFLDMLTNEDKDLRIYALAGLCNLSADPKLSLQIKGKGETNKIASLLHDSNNIVVLNALTTLFYLLDSTNYSQYVDAEAMQRVRDLSCSSDKRLRNLASLFLSDTCNASTVEYATSLLQFRRHFGISRALYLKVGDKTSVTRLVTIDDVKTFANVTGDSNDIHLNEAHPIVHGALLNGLVSAVIGTQLPGHGTMVVHQTLRFPKPCYAGEEVMINVEVTNVRKIVSVEFAVIVPKENKTVLEGDAKLFFPK